MSAQIRQSTYLFDISVQSIDADSLRDFKTQSKKILAASLLLQKYHSIFFVKNANILGIPDNIRISGLITY
jgi:hypothetical protein